MIGRAAELRLLEQVVAELKGGSGRLLWVEGEPGIGKTALLDVLRTDATRQGCLVLAARAEEFGQRFPLRVLLDCLDPQRRLTGGARHDEASLLGALPPTDPVMATVETLVSHVEGMCADGPVLLVLDDLQWADDASLLVWHRLVRLVGQLPLLLAASFRPVPRRVELAQLRRGVLSRDPVLITLGPLPPDDVQAMVAALTDGRPDHTVRQLARHAGGNPLYVREVVEAYQRDGGNGSSPPVPLPLAGVINDRLSFLSEDTLELLRMAALLGMTFSVSDLATVTGRAPTAMIGAVGEAVAGGVLVESQAGLAFRHGLIHQALYQGLPAGLRLALHRQAAQALDAAGVPAYRVAEQLTAAPEPVDAWLLEWLARCAPALAHQAPRIAEDLLRRAVGSPVAAPGVLAELEAHLATAMFVLSRYEEVDRIARSAATRAAGPDRRGQLAWYRAYALLRLSCYDEAIQAIEETLAESALPPGEVAGLGSDAGLWPDRLVALRALVLANSGRMDEGEEGARALLSGPEPDRLAAGYALHVLSLAAVISDRTVVALSTVERALDLVGQDPQATDLRLLLMSNRASMMANLDRPAEADAAIAEMLAAAERAGIPMRLAVSRLTAAEHWYLRGRWDDAVAELEALEGDLLDAHTPYRLRLHGLAALVAAHRGDGAALARYLGPVPMRDIHAGDARHNSIYLFLASAAREEQAGDLRGALATLLVLCEPAVEADLAVTQLWLPDVARLALACGEQEPAEHAVELARSYVDRAAVPSRQGALLWCEGLLARDPAAVLAAAEHNGVAGREFDRGRALEDAAVLLAVAGDLVAARARYDEAVGTYVPLGAAWDLHRADVRMRGFGLRRGQRGPRRRAGTGWAALTPTELRVARLVTEGLSNQEIANALFLSRRTVETHISHILLKLAARSRAEIAREAARQERGA